MFLIPEQPELPFFFFALLDSIPGMSPFHDFFVLTKMDADLDGDREWMEI